MSGHDSEESVFSPVQVLILSLFLQLLVFFILMNSISAYSQAQERMKLMKDAMRGLDPLMLGNNRSIFPGMGNSQGSGTADQAHDQMARFAHEIPGLTDKAVRRSGMLEITLGASALNQLLGIAPPGVANGRLLEMIEFVRDHKNDGYVFVLIQGVRPEIYANGIKDSAPLYYAVQMWSQKLVALGVTPDHLRVGVAAGHPGAVTLRLERVAEIISDTVPGTPANSGDARGAPL